MKNSNDTIGNQTCDLPACSKVPQPTAPPRAPKASVIQTQNGIVFPSVNSRTLTFSYRTINDPSPRVNTLSESVTLTVDTGVIISSKNFNDTSSVSKMFASCSKWCMANNMARNLDETNIINLTYLL